MNEIEQLTGIPLRTNKSVDLGTEYIFSDSAEMYSNSNKNKKENKKENTFQQSNANVRGQAPTSFASPAQAPLVKKDQGIPEVREKDVGSTEKKYGRRLNHQNDLITEMHLQIGHVKQGDRHARVKAYISIKTDSDARYMIFMRSALTTALDETFRSIKKDCCKVLESEADNLYNDHKDEALFLGRVKYKPTKGSKIQDYHRKNLPLSLLSLWIQDGVFHASFYLLDQHYEFVLDEPITSKQQQFYCAQGTWHLEESAMSIDDAFGG